MIEIYKDLISIIKKCINREWIYAYKPNKPIYPYLILFSNNYLYTSWMYQMGCANNNIQSIQYILKNELLTRHYPIMINEIIYNNHIKLLNILIKYKVPVKRDCTFNICSYCDSKLNLKILHFPKSFLIYYCSHCGKPNRLYSISSNMWNSLIKYNII